MQYARPGGKYFAGDCMPFAHDGHFHLYYLIDDSHHAGRGGLGGHQWAHLTTTDLVHWTRHPLALELDKEWEASLCTGSVLYHEGAYHAFYPTRTWQRTEVLSHAVGSDGIAFTKTLPNPFLGPPTGYAPADFRDPFACVASGGTVKLLVTARIENPALTGLGGCIIRYGSADMTEWEFEGPVLFPGSTQGYEAAPECPDYFAFKGRHYIAYGQGLRTFYRVSDDDGATWARPLIDTLGNGMLAVMKTAPFGGNRRIGVAWIGSRIGDVDTGQRQWGGHLVFRELVALPHGALGTKFPAEMVPDTGVPIAATLSALTNGARVDGDTVAFDAPATIEVASLADLTGDYRLRGRIAPDRGTYRFGVGLRGDGAFANKYLLSFTASTGNVKLGGEEIEGVYSDGEPVDLDIVLHDDIIDVCVNERHCLINRLGDLKGPVAFFYCEGGRATVSRIKATRVRRAEDFGF